MTPAPSTWQAPAKINLFLHVTGRRPDGYHTIQSVMQLVDLCDAVTITVRDDGRVARARAIDGVPEDQDLTVRAARLLQAASQTPLGATIAVQKRIPMGGGLGGGSSDAATTLLALNRLWNLDWPRARLAQLGLELGADVPFFVGGDSAFVEGIGESLTPIAVPEMHYAIVHPGVGVPTVAIFTAPELTRDTVPLKISDFSANAAKLFGTRFGEAEPATNAAPVFRNDLEPVAAARFPQVRAALEWLAGRPEGGTGAGNDGPADWPGARGPARMSGSGACVFRAFDRAEAAAACVAALPTGWSGWIVRSVARHPHRDAARD